MLTPDLDGLLAYLVRHQDERSRCRSVDYLAHSRLLDYLEQNYGILGISGHVSSFREVSLPTRMLSDAICQTGEIDLVLVNDSDDVYIVEAKNFTSRKSAQHRISRRKLKSQLFKAYNFFKDGFGISAARCVAAYKKDGTLTRYDLNPDGSRSDKVIFNASGRDVEILIR